jgi:hypothetical protein
MKTEQSQLGRYEDVVFLQGDDAIEPLKILDEQGEKEVFEYLVQWHRPLTGEHETRDNYENIGTSDYVIKIGSYTLFYNLKLGYIGLMYDSKKNEKK